jgi:hypothetical protein
MPAGVAAHVPTEPGNAHVWQEAQLPLQHTPSTQKLLVHCEAEVQGAPRPFLPQRFCVQGVPVTHWLASVHELKQSVPPELQT